MIINQRNYHATLKVRKTIYKKSWTFASFLIKSSCAYTRAPWLFWIDRCNNIYRPFIVHRGCPFTSIVVMWFWIILATKALRIHVGMNFILILPWPSSKWTSSCAIQYFWKLMGAIASVAPACVEHLKTYSHDLGAQLKLIELVLPLIAWEMITKKGN